MQTMKPKGTIVREGSLQQKSVLDIIEMLSSLCSPLIGRRIEDFKNVYVEVGKYVGDACKSMGLVFFDGKISLLDSEDHIRTGAFDIQVKHHQDKRWQRARKGKIEKVIFSIPFSMPAAKTEWSLSDYIHHMHFTYLTILIDNHKATVSELEKNLEQHKQFVKELTDERSNLTYKI